MRRGRYGFWLRVAVAVLRPLVVVLTKHEWRGAHRLPPTGGVIVVPNHISYVDPLAVAHFVWDAGRVPRFLAKATLFRLPLAGRVIRGAGQIPVERESRDASHAYHAALAAARAGECLVIYPEGTMTRDPQLWPMVGKSGATRIALATGVPLLPLAQWGAHEILRPYTPNVHLLPRKTMRMSLGPPVDLSDLAGQELTPGVLREATGRVMDALTAEVAALRGEPAPAQRYDPRAAALPVTGDPRAGLSTVATTGDPTQVVAADERERA